jgi:photosystem I subunit IX
MQKQNQQKAYFLQYLSLVPVLAVVLSSAALAIWMILNYFVPDLLFYP